MVVAVEAAIAGDRHLSAAAGTGTGKSLAYLVPAVLSGKRVVIATATKALQDQLAAKDVPLVQQGLRGFSFAVLKGRSNYLCVQRLVESRTAGDQGVLGEDGASSGRHADDVKAVLDWAAKTRTGDRAELEIEPDPRVWASFSVGADECPGAQRCPSGESCFAERAKTEASGADVVAVNHHLLCADMASEGAVLPDHDVVVVDEAHALEDTATDSLGAAVGAGRIRGIAAACRAAAAPPRPVDDLIEVAERLESELAAHVGKRLTQPLPPELAGILELARTRLERLESELAGADARRGAKETDRQPQLRAALGAGRLRADLDRLAALREEDVAWVEEGRRPQLRIAPIDVAPLLSERLFATRTVVLTSATITSGLARRLGAPVGGVDEIDVGSPFDYPANALLYCAAHLPDRRSPAAEAAIHEELAALIGAAGGRTLALFTSHGAMTRAAAALRGVIPFTLLVQGELAKPALVSRFAQEHAACLFATMGFWQGVDVPGETLSLVVIDRIPFPRPDDPLIEARRERAGRAAFLMIDVPRAATMLAQGAGRLIRSASDRGVVAVLDPRLATASYRWALVRALPPMRRTKDRKEVEAFLGTLAGAAFSVTEAVEQLAPALPVALHPDVQVEVGAGRQRAPHRLADRLQHRAGTSDDDRPLTRPFDEDLASDVGPVPLGDPAGDRVRQLVADGLQQLLAHQLGDEYRLGRVAHRPLFEIARTFWQAGDDVVDEF